MRPRTEEKIVLVVRRTRLDELIVRFNTLEQARFYVERLGADFADYQAEDETYKQARRRAESILSRHGRLQVVDRDFVPNFIFGPKDTVVALGQDGLVANVLKYLDGRPLIGVNPDAARWEGVLLPFTVDDLHRLMPEALEMLRPARAVTMAQATLNTGESLCGVNDLFIGPRSHTSARYTIQTGERREDHSSSGIVVSTGLGSTGWLLGIRAGATGIASSMVGHSLERDEPTSFEWDADYLCFSVREPWPGKTSGAKITCGTITQRQSLRVESHMPEHGVIFSDGVETDFLRFNAGAMATIVPAERKGYLVT